MPKRSSATRGGTQRQKQKSFELVRPATTSDSEVASTETDITTENENVTTATVTPLPEEHTVTEEAVATSSAARSATPATPATTSEASTTAKASASARLAARRQATQRAHQQRSASAMITADHFAYVKRDLALIGSLAVVFFAAIIVLYFVLL